MPFTSTHGAMILLLLSKGRITNTLTMPHHIATVFSSSYVPEDAILCMGSLTLQYITTRTAVRQYSPWNCYSICAGMRLNSNIPSKQGAPAKTIMELNNRHFSTTECSSVQHSTGAAQYSEVHQNVTHSLRFNPYSKAKHSFFSI